MLPHNNWAHSILKHSQVNLAGNGILGSNIPVTTRAQPTLLK